MYTDNLDLAPGKKESVWGIIASSDVKFSGETETLRVTGGLNLSFNHYFGDQDLDTTNYDASIRSSYRTERDVFAFNMDAIRDATLVSELAETGVVLAYRQRNLQTVNPSWSRALTEVTSLRASYTFTDAHYDDAEGTRLIDYRDQSASLALQTRVSERGTASATAYYDRYETTPDRFAASTYGVQVGYEYSFSETLHGALVVGKRWTQSDLTQQALFCNGPIIAGFCFGTLTPVTLQAEESSSGYTLRALLEKQFETDTVGGSLTRDIYPSGIGALVQSDRVEARWTRRWSQLDTTLSAAVYDTRYVGGAVVGSDSRYYRIDAQATWRFAEGWAMDAGYRYARQEYKSQPLVAKANLVYASVSYTWPKISASR